MQIAPIFLLMCLTFSVDAHSFRFWRWWRFRSHAYVNRICDPCHGMNCARDEKCYLIQTDCTSQDPCPVEAQCILDINYNSCTIGKPMRTLAGAPIECASVADCPADAVCEKTTVGATEVTRCCHDPAKCKKKYGRCPTSTDTTTCTEDCVDDGVCDGTEKCCATACTGGKACVVPLGWFE